MSVFTTIDLPLPARIDGGGYQSWLEICRRAGIASVWISPACRELITEACLELVAPVSSDAALMLLRWVDKLMRDLTIIPADLKIDTYTVTTRTKEVLGHKLTQPKSPDRLAHVRLFALLRDKPSPPAENAELEEEEVAP